MEYEPQRFVAPDGTEMVVLTAAEFARLSRSAAEGGDAGDARATLESIAAGQGTMPAEVLALILDEGLSPLAAWRRHRRLSQVELARRTGLSQVWISRIEAGVGHGTPRTRRLLARALDAPVWALDDESQQEELTPTPLPVKARQGKRNYDALTAHLRSRGGRTVRMRFDEVEAVIGSLPRSAFRHQAWWHESGHSHARAWVDAGYRATPDLSAAAVTFRKT